MAHHCYLNNKIDSVENTNIHITDLGLLRGYGLFDYFRTYNGRPFQWDWYWERFDRSAKLMKLPNPISKEKAYSVVMALIEKSGLEDCGIRFVLTGGYSPDAMKMIEPNLLIISEDIHPVKESEYEAGMKVISHEYVRDYPEIKSTDYKHLMILQSDIREAGATDVLFHKDGKISELSRSNVFIVKNNVIATPDTQILRGITRRYILELAKANFKVEERSVALQEVLEADEVFTTSTTKKVLPITRIDNQLVGSENRSVSKFLLEEMNHHLKTW
ncbi:aminotransferase class IV [Emticicia oligotrophica DSM 17448]|uniref:branched-chain-amino-acid transaminase n=1 Tax=Emticicia oligotrophica (strain DSM 17448 / CIP 109782 / MTCC 6937 / GPTSA100-15) TaxID=929562 RepID=A0ABM5MZL1_EMTOG|nr:MULTISPECIES: aminotransferase class IV [Emticicia]AFK02632.1 aminotransferase class IV [Emticicia oligotrophica DSM 17448]